jgi:hypothetical protein
VLTVSELGVVLLEPDSLFVQCRRKVVDVVLCRCRTDRREAEAGVDRDELAVDTRCERELVLECDLELGAALTEPGFHAFEERPLADGSRLTVELQVVDQHCAGVGCIRQHAKGLRVRYQPDLADGAHPLDGLKLVERVHGLHRDRQSDPAADAAFEAVHGAGFRTYGPVVAAPEETDEAEIRLVRSIHDVTCLHYPALTPPGSESVTGRRACACTR